MITPRSMRGRGMGALHFVEHSCCAFVNCSILPVRAQYYTLPFCRTAGKQQRHHHELGEYLVGDRKVTAPYQVRSWQLALLINRVGRN
jgi:hypothetical protein